MEVDFIGLGAMGKPMSKNLLKAGCRLVVFDFNKDTVKEVTGCGAVPAASGREVVERCGVVITIVPNSPHVHTTVLGENGVTDGARPGTVLIDMSSIDPTESKAVGAELAKRGIDMLDAPVSGGEPKTIGGALSIMVGDRKELFDKHYDTLMVMADSVVYVGKLGSGNVVELADQIVAAVNITAVSEALTSVKKAGTNPELIYQAIHGGLAGFIIMSAKASMMLSRNFKPGFRIELHVKDLNNALDAAYAISSPVPLTGQLTEIVQGLRAGGYEKEDHVSIVKYYEKIANTTVES